MKLFRTHPNSNGVWCPWLKINIAHTGLYSSTVDHYTISTVDLHIHMKIIVTVTYIASFILYACITQDAPKSDNNNFGI